MKKIISISLFSLSLLVTSCADGQSKKLDAKEFAEKIKQTEIATILDVRTPGEYSGGHLANAQNIDCNSSNFDEQIEKLDKDKPVFVYCLSGGRSSTAANKLQKHGFKDVYEMEGGMMMWRAAQLPESTDKAQAAGMSKEDYDALLVNDKMVLIDFYADWCGPCKKMKPFLDEIAEEQKDKVVIIRINADENTALCNELSVNALPTIFLYKNKTMMWYNVGYTDKNTILKYIKYDKSKSKASPIGEALLFLNFLRKNIQLKIKFYSLCQRQ